MYKTKRIKIPMIISLVIFLLAGCGSSVADNIVSKSSGTEKPQVLVAYYSLSGNTQKLAEQIHKEMGGDIFEIKPKVSFPESLSEADQRSKEERTTGNLPELEEDKLDLSDYDLILLGGPVWSDTLATPLESFIQNKDFSNTIIAPFYTFSSDDGNYEQDFQDKLPKSIVKGGLGLSSSKLSDKNSTKERIGEWIKKMNISSETSSEMENTNSDRIEIKAGDTVIQAELNDSPAAKEFKKQLPQKISMRRMGDHEYYGSLAESLTHSDSLQTGYSIGDLAFWTPGNLFALYFAEPNDDPEGLMILGKVTSDVKEIDRLTDNVDMQITFAE